MTHHASWRMLWGQIPGPYGLVSPILPRVVALNQGDAAVFEIITFMNLFFIEKKKSSYGNLRMKRKWK